jgi:hypothetical protein
MTKPTAADMAWAIRPRPHLERAMEWLSNPDNWFVLAAYAGVVVVAVVVLAAIVIGVPLLITSIKIRRLRRDRELFFEGLECARARLVRDGMSDVGVLAYLVGDNGPFDHGIREALRLHSATRPRRSPQ